MGKIVSKGTAKMEFTTDVMIISVTVSTINQSERITVSKGKEITENILYEFQKLGIEPHDIELIDENILRQYNSNSYNFVKSMNVTLKSDLKLLNKITEIISEYESTCFSVEFDFSDPHALEDQVSDAAIENSRIKAERLAEKLGMKIVGAEEVTLVNELPMAARGSADMCFKSERNSLSDKLALRKKKISRDITISWLTE